jgi:hypothetical protein
MHSRTLKESQCRARYWLTWSALNMLTTYHDKSHSRKDLFVNFQSLANLSQESLRKEARSVKWQQTLLAQLVARGLIKDVSNPTETLYACADKAALDFIVQEWNQGNGQLIPALVFSDEFDFDLAFQRLTGKSARPLPEPEDPRPPMLDLVPDLVKLLDELTKQLGSLATNLSAHFGELEKKAGGANKRLDLLETRLAELSKKQDSALTKLGELLILAGKTDNREPVTQELERIIKDLSGHMVLRDIATQLSKHLDDGKALHGMVMEALTTQANK